MKRSLSGMAVLELVVALAVAGIIASAGMRAFAGIGEYLHRRNGKELEALAISGLESRFRRNWDQRLAHSFQDEPWLLIEGRPMDGGTELTRIRMRIPGPDGQAGGWELERTGAGWIERRSGEAVPAIEPLIIRFRYSGIIHLDLSSGEWLPGTGPARIHWRFPDARFQENQVGFAVGDIWQ